MKTRITKLNKTKVELSNGTSFVIVHDFKNMEGAVDSFDAAFNSWLARTSEYTMESFIRYVKHKEPERIFLSLKEYDEITINKVENATKEEYEAENN